MKAQHNYRHMVALATITMCIALTHWACNADEEQQWATAHPSAIATTQRIETMQRRLDPAAQAVQEGAQTVQQVAQGAGSLGVPGAGAVALIASGIGTLLGIYNERRRGTVPLKSALTQVVQSVDAAFPNRTADQKIALAAMQDQATKQLVSVAKRG